MSSTLKLAKHIDYEARAAITRHLIENKGFSIVAIEGNWPDAAAWQWLRTPGDIVFAIGGLLMAFDVILKLRGYFQHKEPGCRPSACSGVGRAMKR